MPCHSSPTIVVVPTYNERDNLPTFVEQVLMKTACSMVIVDDASPDGTGQLADELRGLYPHRIFVLHRSPPRGLGRAYRDGLQYALELGAKFVCQMDADLSHDPSYLPKLVAAASKADVAIGSRYVRGSSVANWPLHRLLLSMAGNAYVRIITGLGVRDATSGFKCWRREALRAIMNVRLRSEGYALQFEMLFHAARRGQRIVEVPIIFVERREGASKISGRVVGESLFRPWQLLLTGPELVEKHQPPWSSDMHVNSKVQGPR